MCCSTRKSLFITDNRQDGPPTVFDGLYERSLGNCWVPPVDSHEEAFRTPGRFPKDSKLP